ncbi:MAG: NAD(P)-dependent oxidoreductase [Pseudomonadota bacterium]
MTAPILVVEDDPFPRLLQVILDPAAPAARVAAFGDFFAHDLPDFGGWCAALRSRLGKLNPATVRLVADQGALAASLAGASIAVVESLRVGEKELAVANGLRVIQKYGTITANIDTAACAQRGIPVLTLRRRANMACAEHALAMMLALARRLCETDGLISVEQLRAAGFAPAAFDRAHTANANWARIPGLRTLHGSQLGIVGMGEIGRELALRAAACGMRIVYSQRSRLPAADETRYGAGYAPLAALLAESDYVSLHLPGNAATRGIIGQRELEHLKPGAMLINISRAELVDRTALLDALRTGRLSGFATDTPYEEPGRADDSLLALRNVIMTPHLAAQPRFNALGDFEEMLINLAGFI